MPLALAGPLMASSLAAVEVVQLEVTVDPLRGSDALAEHSDGCRASRHPVHVRSLAGAQTWLRAAAAPACLNDRPANITVHLSPGKHSVPRGGLRLEPADSPRHGGKVRWKGSAGPTASTISGGVAVVDWQPAAPEPELPPGVWEAAVPPGLPAGFVARHMFVNGNRLSLSRVFMGLFALTLPCTHRGTARD
eukprot:SAG31_NODE_849_length_11529_cov_3.342257_17_plen_192_part_00